MSDIQAIHELTTSLYKGMKFVEGIMPDFNLLRSVFVRNALIINGTPGKHYVFDLASFLESVEDRMLGNPDFHSFEEREVYETTQIFGNIAQRVSTFEARWWGGEDEPFFMGVNMIQFVKIDEDWRVANVVWNKATPEIPLTKEFLSRDSPLLS
ncbi:hypothetical protein [Pontibacter sp. G13]|uniref:hypothetical protein n=1 Tax=Pontibacter sp. G13 TaxID=3074898 RepID=UPI00288BA4BA|nr:hypothetical protein [Pontibacter sp. G13]WNJ18895.1 hypothetical protein RJD25_00265 [Pontibacter sp. G13]